MCEICDDGTTIFAGVTERYAGVQVVLVPIAKKEEERALVNSTVDALAEAARAAGIRAVVDASTDRTPGWKFNFWEMKVNAQNPHVNTFYGWFFTTINE